MPIVLRPRPGPDALAGSKQHPLPPERTSVCDRPRCRDSRRSVSSGARRSASAIPEGRRRRSPKAGRNAGRSVTAAPLHTSHRTAHGIHAHGRHLILTVQSNPSPKLAEPDRSVGRVPTEQGCKCRCTQGHPISRMTKPAESRRARRTPKAGRSRRPLASSNGESRGLRLASPIHACRRRRPALPPTRGVP